MTSPDVVDVLLSVHGTVQGVGFRWWAREQLEQRGLDGAATNLPDGTVELLVRGPRDAVEDLTRAVRGPSAPGHVTQVRVVSVVPADRPTGTQGTARTAPTAPGPTEDAAQGPTEDAAQGPTEDAAQGPTEDAAPAQDQVPADAADRPRADHDVVVVGGGPAGLSAALVLGRSRRDVLVVDDGHPRNGVSGHLQGYLGQDGVTPAQFLAQGRQEVARYGVALRAGRVTRLLPAPTDRVVEVLLEDGTSLSARRVLVTTGLSDELPDIPGIAERWGRDVLHCPYCHGWEVRDETLVVLATSVADVDKALTMQQWSPDVRLVLHGPVEEDLPEATRARLDALGVRVTTGPVERLVVEDDRVTAVRLADGTDLSCDALVVQPRLVARDELLVAVGVELATGPFGEFVVTDETGATGVPGIWAAGNVADPAAQVVVAAAAGYRAALAVDHDLIAEDADLAVAARRPSP